MPSRAKKLSNQERLFVHEYLVDNKAALAGVRAGYAKSTAYKCCPLWIGPTRKQCPPNKRHVWDAIQKAMDKRAGKVEVTADRVLAELCKIAFANADEFAAWVDGNATLIPSNKLTRDQTAAISSVIQKRGQFGDTVEVKLYDKQKALEMIARHLGMFNDGLNLNIQGLGDMILDARRRKKGEEASE